MENYFFEEMLVEESSINVQNLGKESNFDGFNKISLELSTENAVRLKRRAGSYITFNVTGDYSKTALIYEVSRSICCLIDKYYKKLGSVLLVGLGNENVVADSLGASTVRKINPKTKIRLQKFCPSVKGVTNIDSVSLVKSVVMAEKPDLIIVIDSLATRDFSKLVSSVQLTDSGIVAGGGVTKSEKLFALSTMGVPVVAVGVPMIINLVGENTFGKKFLCPHNVDVFIDKISDILAKSITSALK